MQENMSSFLLSTNLACIPNEYVTWIILKLGGALVLAYMVEVPGDPDPEVSLR